MTLRKSYPDIGNDQGLSLSNLLISCFLWTIKEWRSLRKSYPDLENHENLRSKNLPIHTFSTIKKLRSFRIYYPEYLWKT